MYCCITRLRIKPGREPEFLQLQRELSELTHEHEPDTVIYDVLRQASEPLSYVCYARFRDRQAFEFHQAATFRRRLHEQIAACAEEPIDRQFYDFIG